MPELMFLDDIIVGPGDNLQEAIEDAGTTPIRLRSGVYTGGFKVQKGTQLLAYPGESPVLMGAERVPASNWTKNGNAWSIPWDIPMYQHPSRQVRKAPDSSISEAGLRHQAAMQPHMIVVDGQPLQTVYRTDDLMPGTMYVEGTSEKPKRIWARFMDDLPPDQFDIRAAIHQHIISASQKNASDVVLEGLHFRYCANTGYQGMIDFPELASGWRLHNLDLQWSNTEGLRLMGVEHELSSIVTNNHGQSGISSDRLVGSTLTDIETSFNNWKGFDPKWDAGNKLRYSRENTLKGIKAIANPIWWDIWNSGNRMEDFEILDSICWGLMVEFNSTHNHFSNGLIRGTRVYEGAPDNGAGLSIQGGVTNCSFSKIRLEENEGGAVHYKKKETRNGGVNFSGLNTFEAISRINNGHDNRWVVEGRTDYWPDIYKGMDKPSIEIWHR